MQRLEVSAAVRPIYGSLGVKRLMASHFSSSNSNRVVSVSYESPFFRKSFKTQFALSFGNISTISVLTLSARRPLNFKIPRAGVF